MKEQPEGELYAELAALRQRLDNLEAEREAARHQARRAQRPTFLRKCLLGPLPLALFVVGSGLLYAQGDALFIDAKGNVGIGDLTPQGFQVVLPEKNKPVNPKAGITLAGGQDGNANIEVRNNGTGTPYIDFAQKTDSDYDARLRLIAPGKLAIEGATLFTAGNVGIGTDDPKEKLSVVGDTRVTGNFSTETLTTSTLSTGALDTTGSSTLHGAVSIEAPSSAAALGVKGEVRIDGGVTSKPIYQRDDFRVPGYDLSPRYHLSLTAESYDGTTKVIPDQTLKDLCGDADGCEVRLGMTRWENGGENETASRSSLFYYSSEDGRWRASYDDKSGRVKNGNVEHAVNVFDTCFFTDGTYEKKKVVGDTGAGMALLVWHTGGRGTYHHAKRTCELTLID